MAMLSAVRPIVESLRIGRLAWRAAPSTFGLVHQAGDTAYLASIRRINRTVKLTSDYQISFSANWISRAVVDV
jgi:hypothetical protein